MMHRSTRVTRSSHLKRKALQARNTPAYLPDGCVKPLATIVFLLAGALFLAFHIHPQGVELIPWLLNHW